MDKFPEWLATEADGLEEAARPNVAKASALALRLSQGLSERTRDFLGNLAD
jgi:hypothetical protein